MVRDSWSSFVWALFHRITISFSFCNCKCGCISTNLSLIIRSMKYPPKEIMLRTRRAPRTRPSCKLFKPSSPNNLMTSLLLSNSNGITSNAAKTARAQSAIPVIVCNNDIKCQARTYQASCRFVRKQCFIYGMKSFGYVIHTCPTNSVPFRYTPIYSLISL